MQKRDQCRIRPGRVRAGRWLRQSSLQPAPAARSSAVATAGAGSDNGARCVAARRRRQPPARARRCACRSAARSAEPLRNWRNIRAIEHTAGSLRQTQKCSSAMAWSGHATPPSCKLACRHRVPSAPPHPATVRSCVPAACRRAGRARQGSRSGNASTRAARAACAANRPPPDRRTRRRRSAANRPRQTRWRPRRSPPKAHQAADPGLPPASRRKTFPWTGSHSTAARRPSPRRRRGPGSR